MPYFVLIDEWLLPPCSDGGWRVVSLHGLAGILVKNIAVSIGVIFDLRFGPFRSPKRPISQSETAYFAL